MLYNDADTDVADDTDENDADATYPCSSMREHPKGAILETCDLWDIRSER